MVRAKGLEVHTVKGEDLTIIGCIGDTVRVDPKLFEVDSSVEKVMHVQEPYKLVNRAFHPDDNHNLFPFLFSLLIIEHVF